MLASLFAGDDQVVRRGGYLLQERGFEFHSFQSRCTPGIKYTTKEKLVKIIAVNKKPHTI